MAADGCPVWRMEFISQPALIGNIPIKTCAESHLVKQHAWRSAPRCEEGERPVRHWLLLGAGLLILAGCGTVEGLGKDIADVARWSRGQISR